MILHGMGLINIASAFDFDLLPPHRFTTTLCFFLLKKVVCIDDFDFKQVLYIYIYIYI
jgi:hypothetical protein